MCPQVDKRQFPLCPHRGLAESEVVDNHLLGCADEQVREHCVIVLIASVDAVSLLWDSVEILRIFLGGVRHVSILKTSV